MPHISIHVAFWAVFIVLLLGTCGLAIWKGGPAERYGALLILFFALLWEFGRLLPPSFAPWMPLVQLVGDGLTAVGLLVVAMRYASLWLGGALLFQAVQFSLHSFYLVTGRPIDMLYLLINNVNLYAILGCLALGTAMSWREQRRALRTAEASRPTLAL
ncbi:MAG: hypothetical protein ACK41C_02895 [Phenylobacterium sp.]|jgi:hypothetical protein|uniref:hypothetical protein n=1 Tax=Phenylobacterium sp. TaxID=1871053 RepID=UPI00391911CD